MIPVELQLNNFMAYQTPVTLDFSDFHVACLTGDNGAGKSTLLDAITWVLWGKARVNQADDLIHLGQTEMEVSLSFQLGQETYRVLRRRNATKRGKSELHFHIADAGGWRTLTENNVRATQAKIDRLLRLDYDTFINSAFLLQGRANEFTSKRPGERKEILSDILGLGVYDEYADRAKEKGRDYQDGIIKLEGKIDQTQAEMANEATYRAEWQTGQTRALQLNDQLRAAEAALHDLRQKQKNLELKQQALHSRQKSLKAVQTDLNELSANMAQLETDIKRYQEIIARKTEIETGYQQLQTVEQQLKHWQDRLEAWSVLNNEKLELEKRRQQTESQLQATLTAKQNQQTDLRPKIDALDRLQQDLVVQQTRLAALAQAETARETTQQTLQTLNAEQARLAEENKQLKQEMNKIKGRITQLKAAGATCPVCARPLDEDHRQRVLTEFQTDGTTKGDAYRNNQQRSKQIAAELKTEEKNSNALNEKLKQQRSVERRHAQLGTQIKETLAAQETVTRLQTESNALQTQLTDDSFEPELRDAIKALADKIAIQAYDQAAHQTAKKDAGTLKQFAEEYQTLNLATERLTELKAQLTREQTRAARLNQQLNDDLEAVTQLKKALAELPKIMQLLAKNDQTVNNLQHQYRLARDAVAAAQQKIEHVLTLSKSLNQLEDELTDLRQAQQIYAELRAAFGKRGVQALLIEHAIPELEAEANNILSRMTDGRVHLQFITQRNAKANNNVIETLDIRIADELGTRDYDLYSGGEAFRVNFAIRIALSKLLARRAGARLQTLVIDEGFGTQDAQGREKLVEAIRAIQADFEKIVVITHIEALKEAFPVQIYVEKTPDGSIISAVT